MCYPEQCTLAALSEKQPARLYELVAVATNTLPQSKPGRLVMNRMSVS